jgi:GntR family transcriptional repressor for pyruvate dehydrogenase complex
MFLYLHSGIVRMLREHISLNLMAMEDPTGDVTAHLRRQHLGIWERIRTQQPDDARQAMLAHIDFTWSELARREDAATGCQRHQDQGRLMKVAG